MTRTTPTSLFTIAIATLCTLATASIGHARGAQQTSSGASAASTTAASTDARWDRFAGDWRAESDGTQLVTTAIERATQEMNVFTRRVARGRLRERNVPPASIRMSRKGDLFTIHFAGGEPVSLPISGTPVQVGDRTIRVQPEPDGDGLRHVGGTAEGSRENIFRLEGADRMTMAVTITSSRLPAPVTYTLVFTRAASGSSDASAARARKTNEHHEERATHEDDHVRHGPPCRVRVHCIGSSRARAVHARRVASDRDRA